MARKTRWGLMGCGGIAESFARDLKHSRKGELVAVGSRSRRRAGAFARAHQAARAHGAYEALVQDAEVDVIYVASPHPWHLEHALLAIEAGKHVLCEKPMALNARQARRMIQAAKKHGVFLMEAMWTRFFPAMARLRRWLAEDRIGRVLAVQADFGIQRPLDPQHRLFNPGLGGGALLDLGIYPVSLASMVLGRPPESIKSQVHFCNTGVDDQSSLLFHYGDGVTASLFCASRVPTGHEARIYGTGGRITIPGNFFHPDRLILQAGNRKPRDITFAHPGNGMQFEADHVTDCLRRGRQESDLMPWEESLSVLKTLDRIRRQWKFKYPDES